MKTPALARSLSAAVLTALPLAYALFVWRELPDTIPVHFGVDGKPDGFGPKNMALILPAGLMLVGLGSYALLRNVHRIDPKRPAPLALMHKIATGTLLFVSLLAVWIVRSMQIGQIAGGNLLFVGLGLFFAWLGNLMHSLKPNYFAGFRFPWTLADDYNWRKTHQFGGRLWVGGGLLAAVAALFVPAPVAFGVFMGVTAVLAIGPAAYSYRLFRRNRPAGE